MTKARQRRLDPITYDMALGRDALRTLVPAFNAQRLQGNDGSSFVRPITLRGSPADHVLLLMNGKRRHRAAIVQIGTGHLALRWQVLPPRQIALVRMPRLQVDYRFEGVSDQARAAFMRYFDLYSQRGGG